MNRIYWNSNRKEKKSRQSGMALLTVLVAMMLISLMLFEFQYSTMVERKLAFNDLNQVQAYYLAKSGVKLGLLRISLYGKMLNDSTVQSATGSLPVQTYLNMIWNIPMPPFPPEPEKVEGLLKADKDAAETAMEQTRIEDGQYSHTISSEANKINLNFLVDNRKDKSEAIRFGSCSELFCYVGSSLVNLMERFIRESDDPFEEFGNLKPDEVVYNIMDWVNPGNDGYAGSDKDGYYLSLDPPYRAKRNRFYTKEELRLVNGITPNLYRKLEPHITVYSYDGRININTMTKEVLSSLDPDIPDSAIDEILEYRQEIGVFTDVNSFMEYVGNTLGFSSFTDKFENPEDYFTVASESFLVESLGVIKKSASQVQRSMSVAVALVRASKAGQVAEGVKKEDCEKSNDKFWDTRTGGRCLYRASTESECTTKLAGTWAQDSNGNNCCQIKGQCVPLPGVSSGSGSSGDTTTTKVKPNAVKILHWAEN